MLRHVPRSALIAWTVLLVVAAVSWWAGSEHGGLGHETAGVLVLLLAGAKAATVVSEFMEARGAPLGLRLALAVEVVGGTLALVAIYLA